MEGGRMEVQLGYGKFATPYVSSSVTDQQVHNA